MTPSLAAWFFVMWHCQGLTFMLIDSVVKNGLFIRMLPCCQLCKHLASLFNYEKVLTASNKTNKLLGFFFFFKHHWYNVHTCLSINLIGKFQTNKLSTEKDILWVIIYRSHTAPRMLACTVSAGGDMTQPLVRQNTTTRLKWGFWCCEPLCPMRRW